MVSLYKEGEIQPILSITKFRASRVVGAFQCMQSGVRMVKVQVKMSGDPHELPVSLNESICSI